MKKKGFVFVESVAVLVVVILALTLFISSYKVLVRKSKAKDYYNLPKDKYLLYNIVNFGDSSAPYNVNTSFIAHESTCETYMSEKMSNCSQLFNDTSLDSLLVIYDLNTVLENGTIIEIKDGSYGITSDIIEYLKTLKKTDANGYGLDYVVGVFKRDNKYYYASLLLNK